jgi:hypothetical protein
VKGGSDYNYGGVPGRRAAPRDWLNNYNLTCNNNQRGACPGEATSTSTFSILNVDVDVDVALFLSLPVQPLLICLLPNCTTTVVKHITNPLDRTNSKKVFLYNKKFHALTSTKYKQLRF